MDQNSNKPSILVLLHSSALQILDRAPTSSQIESSSVFKPSTMKEFSRKMRVSINEAKYSFVVIRGASPSQEARNIFADESGFILETMHDDLEQDITMICQKYQPDGVVLISTFDCGTSVIAQHTSAVVPIIAKNLRVSTRNLIIFDYPLQKQYVLGQPKATFNLKSIITQLITEVKQKQKDGQAQKMARA